MRTVLLTSRMARTFWGEFIMSSTYVRNHLLYSSLPYDMSPMEAAFGTVPVDLRYRTLGCDCYTMLDIEGQDKPLIKANPSTLLGYSMESLSYRVRIWSTGGVAYSRNVILDENLSQMELCLGWPTLTLTPTNIMKQAWIRCWIHCSNCLREPTTNLLPTMKKHLIGPSTLHLFIMKSLMTWKMSSSDPDAQYIQINRLTNDRLGGVLKELSKARIVSVMVLTMLPTSSRCTWDLKTCVWTRWRLLSHLMMTRWTPTFLWRFNEAMMLLMLFYGVSRCSTN